MQLLSLQHHLRRVEILHKLVDIGQIALCHIELAGGDIQKRHSVYPVGQVKSAEEVVLLHIQHHIVVRHTGCNQLGDAPFHQPLHRLGVFQLLAYRHPQTRSHQSGQILVNGVIGYSCQIGISTAATCLARQRNTQYLGGLAGILAESLIKITYAEQQHRIGKLAFHLGMLFHQRGFILCILRHKSLFSAYQYKKS